jgi:hypothetical protein
VSSRALTRPVRTASDGSQADHEAVPSMSNCTRDPLLVTVSLRPPLRRTHVDPETHRPQRRLWTVAARSQSPRHHADPHVSSAEAPLRLSGRVRTRSGLICLALRRRMKDRGGAEDPVVGEPGLLARSTYLSRRSQTCPHASRSTSATPRCTVLSTTSPSRRSTADPGLHAASPLPFG